MTDRVHVLMPGVPYKPQGDPKTEVPSPTRYCSNMLGAQHIFLTMSYGIIRVEIYRDTCNGINASQTGLLMQEFTLEEYVLRITSSFIL